MLGPCACAISLPVCMCAGVGVSKKTNQNAIINADTHCHTTPTPTGIAAVTTTNLTRRPGQTGLQISIYGKEPTLPNTKGARYTTTKTPKIHTHTGACKENGNMEEHKAQAPNPDIKRRQQTTARIIHGGKRHS